MTTAIPTCTRLRSLTTWSSLLPFTPRISTVNEVVNAVKAEPAAEYAEDISPTTNKIPTITGKYPCVAIIGNNSSLFCGT